MPKFYAWSSYSQWPDIFGHLPAFPTPSSGWNPQSDDEIPNFWMQKSLISLDSCFETSCEIHMEIIFENSWAENPAWYWNPIIVHRFTIHVSFGLTSSGIPKFGWKKNYIGSSVAIHGSPHAAQAQHHVIRHGLTWLRFTRIGYWC